MKTIVGDAHAIGSIAQRHSLYADTYTHELIDPKDINFRSHISRYYEIYSFDDYNGEFIELWTTDAKRLVKVKYPYFEDVEYAREFTQQDENCTLLELKSVMMPFSFYERYFA